MIKFIAPFKGYKVGSVASLPSEQEEWFKSRQFAINHIDFGAPEELELPPLQEDKPKRKLTTRKKDK